MRAGEEGQGDDDHARRHSQSFCQQQGVEGRGTTMGASLSSIVFDGDDGG